MVFKEITKKVLKVSGFILLLFFLTGLLDSYFSPSRYALSEVTENGFNKVELSSGTYLGEEEKGLFSGNGQFQFLDGVKYAGSWKNSKMNGDGSCSYPGIGTYQGSYKKTVRSGDGTFTWENGDSYKGSWSDDAMSEGTYTLANGTAYVGTFANGKVNEGQLIYQPPQDSEIAELTIIVSDGTASHLSYKLTNGFSYNGDFNGSGNADITYANGDTYSGQVKNGMKDGSGVYHWMQNGTATAYYKGSWIQDHMNGSGAYFYENKEYPNLSGNFENDHPTGDCNYAKEKGNNFTASFENGRCVRVKEE
ncbi:MORN repeat-containing protein [Novisyntrophococcus fermenticellae]|uniref:hypothetical protein n=1 Tax=Novisyntrophococcus fermenticellae TaxID=2068655 RepID=UPI001E58A990|nr:hypothetical protein [Novisyntrophococcus fermenticellae]